MAKLRITYNAPVILTFTALAVAVQLATGLLGDQTIKPYVAAPPFFGGWQSYLGLVSHPLGHANWDHLLGNFGIILLLGPILEERHGSRSLLVMFLITALITGLANLILTDSYLVGASGIVFMLIVLASTANIRRGEIPLTFLAVALLYLGREVVQSFRQDNVSQLAHMMGGIAGGVFGFVTARRHPASAVAARPPAAPNVPSAPTAPPAT